MQDQMEQTWAPWKQKQDRLSADQRSQTRKKKKKMRKRKKIEKKIQEVDHDQVEA